MKAIHTEPSDQPEIMDIPDLVEEAPPPSSPPPRRHGPLPLTHRTAAKAAAFILAILMAVVAVAGILGGLIMVDYDLYTTTEEAYLQQRLRDLAQMDCANVTKSVMNGNVEYAEACLRFRNVASIEIFSEKTGAVAWSWQNDDLPADGVSFDRLSYWNGSMSYYEPADDVMFKDLILPLTTRITFPAEFVYRDDYMTITQLIPLAYDMLYWTWIIGVAAAIAAVVCFVFLMCASGHRSGLPEVQPGWGTRVPLDLLTAGLGLGAFLLIQLAVELSYSYSDALVACVFIVTGVILLAATLGWCMSFALRVKLGGWWKNTVLYRVLRLCWRVLKWFGRGLAAFFRGCGSLLAGIPLVWQAALGVVGLAAIEVLLYLFCILTWYVGFGGMVVCWTLAKILLFALVIVLALMLRRLQKGGEALASGDLSHQVDTRKMLPAFRKHGENLNSLGAGMTIAVEQRLRSERMKTELITNVSHDIKTPLTSIINYADLIGKEQTNNEKIREYSVVLLRQSERLKRLIGDLVEASKASTGNLEVLLAPCEAGVMLTQVAGEFEEKLKAARLELVTTQPERPVKIMADGRRLWRVFDNLVNNICKYAQPGTRVYLTLEEIGGQAVISFKNTSRDPLNIPADELMERFIRGDTSRSTEGNGLGLSIAKSLTDLQQGSFELVVDGDLFKVILKFPILS